MADTSDSDRMTPQAYLQDAIGFLRMYRHGTRIHGDDEDLAIIEQRMVNSLEGQQAALWDDWDIKMVAEAERRGEWKNGRPA